jgi:hypothetical protein
LVDIVSLESSKRGATGATHLAQGIEVVGRIPVPE